MGENKVTIRETYETICKVADYDSEDYDTNQLFMKLHNEVLKHNEVKFLYEVDVYGQTQYWGIVIKKEGNKVTIYGVSDYYEEKDDVGVWVSKYNEFYNIFHNIDHLDPFKIYTLVVDSVFLSSEIEEGNYSDAKEEGYHSK